VSSPASRAIRSVCVIASLLCAPIVAPAQDPASLTGDIRGTVRDSASAEPVFGAQVFVLGSTRGTVTDSAGRYALRVPASAVTIRVQRLGYAPQTREVDATGGSVTVVDFLAHAVVITLSEIQVIGYGTEDRSQVTGALSTLQGSEIAGQPLAGVDAALQGHVPGVQITQNSGDPGNGVSIRIRGASSIHASNQPLFVIDGLPIATDTLSEIWSGGNAPTPLSALDVNEIESITILKDASSAAIYGSRAANGVVLITTKRGHAGKAQFTMDASTGWQNVEKRLHMLNAKDWVAFMNEASANDSGAPLYSAATAAGPSTDWQSQIFRTAPVSNVHLGLSGGSGPIRFSVDGSYFAQTGVELSSSYDRANVRLNADYDVNSRLAIKSSLALSHEVDNRVKSDFEQFGLLRNAIWAPPIYPVRDAQGKYFGGDDQIDGSPLPTTNAAALAAYDRFPSGTDHILGNLEANYFVTPKITLTARAGLQLVHLDENWWESPLVLNTSAQDVGGIAINSITDADLYSLEGFGTYRAGSQDASELTIVGGGSVELNSSALSLLQGEGFSSPALQYAGSATNIVSFAGGPNPDHNRESLFSRANYSWKNRYLVAASLRADGDSRFGPNNRWAYFPALSAGWVMSEEPFMSHFRDTFGSLKLRASFGETGNNNIQDFSFLSTYGSTPYGALPGISPTAIGNLNFRWELTKEWDAGIDWSPYGGRLSVIADYYRKATSGLILDRPILFVSGFTSYLDNVGASLNRGFELAINSENLRSQDRGLAWHSDFNISFIHSEITELYGGQPILSRFQRISIGQPLGEFYLLHFKGVDPVTGDAIYSDSMQNAGSAEPTVTGGLGNSLSFRAFALRTFLEFSHGAKVLNQTRGETDDGGYNLTGKSAFELDRWRHPGDITDEPRASVNGSSGAQKFSDRFLEDGSYLRIQEVTLSWALPAGFLGRRGVESGKLYVSGHNLYSFTKYRGYDPDVSSFGITNDQPGVDRFAYPRARVFSFGISTQW
jgi:TonB-linked SusC/RagA family outer membrane protein